MIRQAILAMSALALLSGCQSNVSGGGGTTSEPQGPMPPGALTETQISSLLEGTRSLSQKELTVRLWAKLARLQIANANVVRQQIDTVLEIDNQNGRYSLRRKK